jgi:hypothetical protein
MATYVYPTHEQDKATHLSAGQIVSPNFPHSTEVQCQFRCLPLSRGPSSVLPSGEELCSHSRLSLKYHSGAGIGGLVLAITIGKYDPSIPIDLYEARDSIDTAGVGITVWRQTHEVMIELGLFDDFKQIFTHSAEGSYSE